MNVSASDAQQTAPENTSTNSSHPVDSMLFERILKIEHSTRYTYQSPVQHSKHVIRLRPCHDIFQEVLDFQLEINPFVPLEEYEDVFGNRASAFSISNPYTELNLIARSRVKIRYPKDYQSFPHTGLPNLPLVWMPWQRQMMQAYLMPLELPETQLMELTDYAMSFVIKNNFELIKVLNDINNTIYNEYSYVSGSTNLNTTPFDVFKMKKGVCQDFSNLFICLARLINIPARYRVGYIYTGGNYENKIQSDASHAWLEVYLPHMGWRGFDPTNGSLAGFDHVRVACGRNFRDATPTSGAILEGGGQESLQIGVKVELENES